MVTPAIPAIRGRKVQAVAIQVFLDIRGIPVTAGILDRRGSKEIKETKGIKDFQGIQDTPVKMERQGNPVLAESLVSLVIADLAASQDFRGLECQDFLDPKAPKVSLDTAGTPVLKATRESLAIVDIQGTQDGPASPAFRE